ncbi:hypothetical protein BJV82DRAFT_509066 [Fennellomyces sp. T-0311]|nr:hypothetical protein BJV82DRAFT_509066 [Fennellomyces sp. T-0311]
MNLPESTRSKSLRKRRLKEAKYDYEARIEQYFQQLTVGCGRSECTNRFCATGKGGIRNLHRQAALVMSIQLASKQESRLCQHHTPHETTVQHAWTEDDEEDEDQDQRPARAKPFLQSLFSSSSFLSLFGMQVEHEQVDKKTRRRRRPKRDHGGLLGPSCNTAVAAKSQSEGDDVDNSYYYQLDSMSDSTQGSFYESDTSSEEGMLLAIRPTIITDLSAGIDQINRTASDIQKASHWCRAVFQNWEGIGNSLLSVEALPLPPLESAFQRIDFDSLEALYKAILHTRSARISETLTESLETLLDRMNMNSDAMTSLITVQDAETSCVSTIVEWCRSLLAIMEWIRVRQKTESAEESMAATATAVTTSSADMWSGILSLKFIQVVNKIASNRQCLIRQVLKQTLASLDAGRMRSIVAHLHDYLIDHFHTGPYKHGEQDSVVMATKFLELAYEANSLPASTVIPASEFNSEAVCKKLNIKNEYRIWRRVLQYGEGRHSLSTITAPPTTSSSSRFYGLNEQQRRTRLFLTTTSSSVLLPYPFANEYQFSWFSYPFLLPPAVKRKILQLDAMSQMSAEYEDACVNHTLVVHARRLLSDAPCMVRNLETNLKSATCPYLLLEIRRAHLVEDTLHQVSRQWVNIKKPLKIRFVGGGEEGMDQGGVQKEFFNVLFEKLMVRSMGLFDSDPETRVQWIRPVVHSEETLRMYEMVGVMMGLAIYNGVIMNLQFPHVLWKILVQPSEAQIDELASSHTLFTFQDLCEGWPTLGHGLQQLLDWPEEVQDVYCRNYEISLDVFGQGIVTWPLQDGGSDIPVTNANRHDFVRDYCTHFLYYAQRDQLLALRRGLWSVMGGSAMDLCTAQVLEVVACGQRQDSDLDLAELERVTEYDDGYSAEHTLIRHFWSIVHHDMTSEQKRKLLFFVTASDRVPVGGLKELTFVVQRNGPDSDRLPTALTCFSRLLLPEYKSREALRDRLITAIENAKGFGLV